MEFRVLGPVGLVVGADYVRLGGAKARTVLAVLVLRAGRVVSVGQLIDAVWGSEPPPTAQALVQTQIAVLRKVLAGAWAETEAEAGAQGGGAGDGGGGGSASGSSSGSGGAAGPSIITRSPGYLLQPGPVRVDLLDFEARAAEGRAALAGGDPERAAARFAEALAVWSGPALGGASPALAMTEALALEQERSRVRKEWIEAELLLGRHHALVPALYGLVAESPVDEALRGRLMLALYRSGRADEALAVCRDGRRIRADELGMDPGPAMKALERAILAEDPGLGMPGPGTPGLETLRSERPAGAGRRAAAGLEAGSEARSDRPGPQTSVTPSEQRASQGADQHLSQSAEQHAPQGAEPEPAPEPVPPTPSIPAPTRAEAPEPGDPVWPTVAADIPAPRSDSPPAPFTLSADPAPVPPPSGGVAGPNPTPHPRRRTLLTALALLTTLTVAAPTAVALRRLLIPTPAFPTAAEVARAPSGGCLPRATDNDDLRNGVYLQTWHLAAMCRNDVLAPLYLVPATGSGSPIVGRLRTGGASDPSWFLCWITGDPDRGGSDLYYYTTADDWAPGQEYRHGWGFVPAAYLAIGADHTRSGLPECPPVPGW